MVCYLWHSNLREGGSCSSSAPQRLPNKACSGVYNNPYTVHTVFVVEGVERADRKVLSSQL